MKDFATLIWALVLGQMVGYIGGALTSGTYNVLQTTIISFLAGITVVLLGHVVPPKKSGTSNDKASN